MTGALDEATVASTVLHVLLVRVGLMLVHVGCVPSGNVNEVYLQHLVSLGVGSVSYLSVGRVLAEGEDWAGLVGVSGWSDWGDRQTVLLWGWVMYAAGLTELVTAGRLQILGNILATAFYTGFLHPLIIHQVWCDGWMTGLRDTAGGVVVHLYAGSTAFGALLALGHRTSESKQVDGASLSVDSQAAGVLGYFLVIASTIQMISGALVPCMLYSVCSVSIGLVTTAVVYMMTCRKVDRWVVVWVLQGGLSALVATSSGLHVFNSLLVLMSSLLGTVGFALFCCLMRMTGLEDYANVLAVHLIPGAISTYLASFNAEGYLIGINPDRILWQALCSLIIFCLSTFLALSVYLALYFMKLLRNSADQAHDVANETNPRQWPFFRKFAPTSRNIIRPGFHNVFQMRRRARKNLDTSKQAETRRSAEFEEISLDNTEIPTTSNKGFN